MHRRSSRRSSAGSSRRECEVRTFAATVTSLVVALALAACNHEGTGFIQLKTAPVSTVAQPALYLDSEKLEPLKKGEAVLTRKVGSTKLQIEGSGGQLTLLCDILVRKN